MIRRPPRSTLDRSSAASDVYKRQMLDQLILGLDQEKKKDLLLISWLVAENERDALSPVSYTHLRAHETVLDLVCRLLLEKKTSTINNSQAA